MLIKSIDFYFLLLSKEVLLFPAMKPDDKRPPTLQNTTEEQ